MKDKNIKDPWWKVAEKRIDYNKKRRSGTKWLVLFVGVILATCSIYQILNALNII